MMGVDLFKVFSWVFIYIQILTIVILVIAIVAQRIVKRNLISKVGPCRSPLNFSFQKNDLIEKGVYKIIVYFTTFLLLLILFIQIDGGQQIEYWIAFVNEINSVEGIVIAYAAMVMAILIFYITQGNKEYYLTVTKREIMGWYYLYECYQLMGIFTVISIVCMLLLQNGLDNVLYLNNNIIITIIIITFVVYQVSISIVLALGLYIMLVIGKMTLSGRKVEMKSNDRLYKIFFNSADIKCVNRTKDAFYINLSYLFKKYIKLLYCKKRIKKVKDIKFIENIENENELYTHVSKIILAVYIILGIIVSVGDGILENYYMMGAVIILTVVIIVMLWLPFINEGRRKVILGLIFGYNPYQITLDKKERFISTESVYPNFGLRKYIRNMENIIALYYIVTTGYDESEHQMIRESLVDMMNYLQENEGKRSNFEKAMYYLPVFTCGYFVAKKCCPDEKDFPSEVQSLYKSFQLTQEEETRFYVSLNSFVRSVCRFRPDDEDKKRIRKGEADKKYYENYISYHGYW